MARQNLIRKFIPGPEAELIEYQMSLISRPDIVKSGIQRLCDHLERQSWPRETGKFINQLKLLATNDNILVRRWAFKGLACP